MKEDAQQRACNPCRYERALCDNRLLCLALLIFLRTKLAYGFLTHSLKLSSLLLRNWSHVRVSNHHTYPTRIILPSTYHGGRFVTKNLGVTKP